MPKNEMPSRREAFLAAQDAARNENDRTEKRWKIQSEMEKSGFEYDLKKGEPDEEKAYSRP